MDHIESRREWTAPVQAGGADPRNEREADTPAVQDPTALASTQLPSIGTAPTDSLHHAQQAASGSTLAVQGPQTADPQQSLQPRLEIPVFMPTASLRTESKATPSATAKSPTHQAPKRKKPSAYQSTVFIPSPAAPKGSTAPPEVPGSAGPSISSTAAMAPPQNPSRSSQSIAAQSSFFMQQPGTVSPGLLTMPPPSNPAAPVTGQFQPRSFPVYQGGGAYLPSPPGNAVPMLSHPWTQYQAPYTGLQAPMGQAGQTFGIYPGQFISLPQVPAYSRELIQSGVPFPGAIQQGSSQTHLKPHFLSQPYAPNSLLADNQAGQAGQIQQPNSAPSVHEKASNAAHPSGMPLASAQDTQLAAPLGKEAKRHESTTKREAASAALVTLGEEAPHAAQREQRQRLAKHAAVPEKPRVITEADLQDDNTTVTAPLLPTAEDDIHPLRIAYNLPDPSHHLALPSPDRDTSDHDLSPSTGVEQRGLPRPDAHLVSNDQASGKTQEPQLTGNAKGIAEDSDTLAFCMATGRKALLSALPQSKQEKVGRGEAWYSTAAAEESAKLVANVSCLGLMQCSPHVYPQPVHWQLIQGCSVSKPEAARGFAARLPDTARASLQASLIAARSVVAEAFGAVPDSRSAQDLVPEMLRGSVQAECKERHGPQDFTCFYVALLWVGSTLTSVALVRPLGDVVAEIPVICTRPDFQNQGLAPFLLRHVEAALIRCGVQAAIMPAVQAVKSVSKAQKAMQNGGPDMGSCWSEKAGYTLASKETMCGLIALPILTYGATPILCKELTASRLPKVRLPEVTAACKPLELGSSEPAAYLRSGFLVAA